MEQALQEKFAPALWDKAIETLGPWARKYAASSLCREIGTVAAERRELSFQYQVLSAEQQFPAVRLSGQVDRVLFYSDGTLGIVDYKTDWFEPGSLQKKAARYQLQITGYALAMGAIFGRSPRDARLYFARTGETMAVDVTSRSLNQAKCQLQDMARFVRSHDQESDYSCRIVQCPECRYQGVCLHE
jgi:ATP-dependent exoDNAse (exonuclease V) beta subunit